MLFMDLSNAFDTINHDLLLAKFRAYGFPNNALKVMCGYLKDRKRRTKINKNFNLEKSNRSGGCLQVPLKNLINELIVFTYLLSHKTISRLKKGKK